MNQIASALQDAQTKVRVLNTRQTLQGIFQKHNLTATDVTPDDNGPVRIRMESEIAKRVLVSLQHAVAFQEAGMHGPDGKISPKYHVNIQLTENGELEFSSAYAAH